MTPKLQEKYFYLIILIFFLIFILMAGIVTFVPLQNKSKESNTSVAILDDSRDLFPDKVSPEYCKIFSVDYHGTYKVVHIYDPWDRNGENRTYLLVQRGEKVPSGYPDAQVFFIPVKRVITGWTAQVAILKALNETSSIIGHNGIKWIYDKKIHEIASKGDLIEVNSGSGLDLEKVINLEPDVVFLGYMGEDDESDIHSKYQEIGLKSVTGVSIWRETHPLGRAEWIKFYSLFFNKEKTANEFFEQIKNNYTAICEKTASIGDKPTLFTGLSHQGSWFADGGGNYIAQFFRDAGGDYIWGNNSNRDYNWYDFEYVYDTAHNADFWINVGTNSKAESVLALDPRYEKFDAVKNNSVYHLDKQVDYLGNNDFYEGGILKPDVILADLVKILHPDLLPDHELYYYRQISTNQTGKFG